MEIRSTGWKDYEVIDAGDGEKLERWGKILLRRPDPACLWPKDPQESRWQSPDAIYHRSDRGGGRWEYRKELPASWTIEYRNLSFKVSPTGFKHTGIFPEQSSNWDWIAGKIRACRRPVRVLNLFAYTGAATLAASAAGAEEVVHLDAARGMVSWARENARLNRLERNRIRWIVDDARKFAQRERRRGNTYDALIMDPPSYGRGPGGEMWKLEEQLPGFVEDCLSILSEDPLFVLVSCYTTGYTSISLRNLLSLTLGKKYPGFGLEVGELSLPVSGRGLSLPCGITARFSR